jgi:hypothetical protein
MSLNEIATEAAAHRAAVVTLLRSYLPHGRRGTAAREVGVSPEYLSRVLSDQSYSEWNKDRLEPRLEPLGEDLADRLAKWLGFDVELRYQLLEHANLSHESHIKTHNEIEAALLHRDFDVILPELLKLHADAGRQANPALASNLYARSYCMAKQLIKNLSPRYYPLEFAQVCLVLNDLEAVLNHNIDGIYHARLARDWAKVGGAKGSNLLGKDADDLWGNALVAEAISTHNLGLDRKAVVFLSSKGLTKMSNTWSVEAALHLLKYTAFAQRTSLREVDKLSDQYLEAVEKFGSKTDQTITRLAFSEAKLRSYLACGLTKASLRKADTELEQCLSETASDESEESRVFAFISQIGVLRSVIFLKTYSQLLEARGDSVRAEKVRADAELWANQAGLAHQLARIRASSPCGPGLQANPGCSGGPGRSRCVPEAAQVSNPPP